MSDTDNTQAAAPVVERNGINKTLTEQTFGKKSNNAGKKFYAPEFSAATFDSDITWAGNDWALAVLNKKARLVFGDIYVSNIDEKTGVLNQAQMEADWADFTAGEAKLADLQEDLEELVGLQQTYALDPEFGEDTENGKKLSEQITEVAQKIKPIRASIAQIKVKYEARAAARKAKADASATKGVTEVAHDEAAAA